MRNSSSTKAAILGKHKAELREQKRVHLRSEMDRHMTVAISNAGSSEDLDEILARRIARAEALEARAEEMAKGFTR